MLFDAKLKMSLPGDSEADAVARLQKALPPGWTFEVEAIALSGSQPPAVSGTVEIKLKAPRPGN